MEMNTCIDCNRETKRGIFCPKCDAVATAYAYVVCNWRPDELKDLVEALRHNSIAGMKEERKGARFLQTLIRHIESKSTREIQPDSIKTALAARLVKCLAHLEMVRKYDASNGEGAHKKIFADAIEEMLVSWRDKKSTTKQAKQWANVTTEEAAI